MSRYEYLYMDLEDIKTPKPGRICYGPSWWAVTKDYQVVFFGSYCSPLCNTNESIVKRFRGENSEIFEHIAFLEMSFLPHDCSDY